MNKKGRIVAALLLLLSLLLCQSCSPGAETAANELTLSGGMGGNEFAQRAAAAKQITVKETEDFFFTDTMLLDRLVTHDDRVDIYYVEGNMVSTRIIFRKDFAAPITQPELRASIEGMYAPIRDAVMHGETVMGMPIMISTEESCLAYHLDVYEACREVGYTLPGSWLQLLEQIAQWDEELWHQQISPIHMTARMLVQTSLDHVMAQQQGRGEEVDFSSEEVVTVVEAAYRAAKNMEEHQADQKERSLFWRQGLTVAHAEADGFHTYPLPLREGETPVIPLRVCVAFINPYSKKQGLAQEFLAAYYQQMDPMMQMALSPQVHQTVEDASAVERMNQLQGTIAWLEGLLADPDSEWNRKDLENQLAECRQQLEQAAQNRYRVDDDSLTAYAQNIQHGVVLDEQLWQEQSISRLMDQMLQGQLTPRGFCQELNRVIQMKNAENR